MLIDDIKAELGIRIEKLEEIYNTNFNDKLADEDTILQLRLWKARQHEIEAILYWIECRERHYR